MSDTLAPLTIDFLRSLETAPRDYLEVMDAWRTACPRLTVWEDALDAELIVRTNVRGGPLRVALTEKGRAVLASAAR